MTSKRPPKISQYKSPSGSSGYSWDNGAVVFQNAGTGTGKKYKPADKELKEEKNIAKLNTRYD